jgi:hypothetical protein
VTKQEYSRAYYAANRDRIKARTRARYKARHDEMRAWARAYYHTDAARRSRRKMVLKPYGLTPEQWDALFIAQGRRCACCGAADPGSCKGWSTDHDHISGAIRGIVCHGCNLGIRWAGDSYAVAVIRCGQFLKYLAKSARHKPEPT